MFKTLFFQIQFHSDYRPAPFERKMIALFASAFECSFLFAATISALFSIVQPKVKNGLLLLALPLCALIPAVAGGQEPAASEKTGEDGNWMKILWNVKAIEGRYSAGSKARSNAQDSWKY